MIEKPPESEGPVTSQEVGVTKERQQAVEGLVKSVEQIVKHYLNEKITTNVALTYERFIKVERYRREVPKTKVRTKRIEWTKLGPKELDSLDYYLDETQKPNATPVPITELDTEQLEEVRDYAKGCAFIICGGVGASGSMHEPACYGGWRYDEAAKALPPGLVVRAFYQEFYWRDPATVLGSVSEEKPPTPLKQACEELIEILENTVRSTGSLYPIGNFPLPWGAERVKDFEGKGWELIYPPKRPNGFWLEDAKRLTPMEVEAERLSATLYILSQLAGNPKLLQKVAAKLQELRSDPNIYGKFYTDKGKAEEFAELTLKLEAKRKEVLQITRELYKARREATDGLRDRELRTGEERAKFKDFNGYFSHVLHKYHKDYIAEKRAARTLPGPQRDKKNAELRKRLQDLRALWKNPPREKSEAEKELEELEKRDELVRTELWETEEARNKMSKGREVPLATGKWDTVKEVVMDSFFDLPGYEVEIIRRLTDWIKQELTPAQ